MTIDDQIQEYKTTAPDTLSNIISCAAALGASYAVTHYGQDMFETPAQMATAATVADTGAYWLALLPQLAYRDLKRLGGAARDHVQTLLKEYIGLFTVMEAVYVAGRSTSHYALQTMEFKPETASLISQVTMMGLTLVALPYLRRASQSIVEKST